MISIALYKPDIPQNTAAIIRLSACFTMKVHIIEPCGFSLDDSRFKRVVMDYLGYSNIIRYDDPDDTYRLFLYENEFKFFIANNIITNLLNRLRQNATATSE